MSLHSSQLGHPDDLFRITRGIGPSLDTQDPDVNAHYDHYKAACRSVR